MVSAPPCILAIAGWYLVYPPAKQKSGPDSQVSQYQQLQRTGSQCWPTEWQVSHGLNSYRNRPCLKFSIRLNVWRNFWPT
jgi:hypothetical protein